MVEVLSKKIFVYYIPFIQDFTKKKSASLMVFDGCEGKSLCNSATSRCYKKANPLSYMFPKRNNEHPMIPFQLDQETGLCPV